jgi:tyrosine-protein kinase Etk/Wzc
MGPLQSLDDLIGMLLRRRVLIILVTVIGTALGAWYAKTRPDLYTSSAVLQVEMPKVAEGGPVSPLMGAVQTLQTIQQQMTTRDNLIALIDRHEMFTDLPGLSVENRVFAMRSAIRFTPVSDAAGRGLSAIIITAEAGTADKAARIANDLAQTILDMGAEGNQAAVKANTAFFPRGRGPCLGCRHDAGGRNRRLP